MKGSKLFLVAGVGLALVAIVLIVAGMSGSKADANKDSQATKVTVVEAVVDIPAHTQLTQADLIEVQVAGADAPADAVHAKTDILGLAYRVPLVKGQRLVMAQTEQPGLRNEIQTGKRALSLPVSKESLLSGLVQSDDYVDVIFHARLNLVRLLPTNAAITPEDQPYYHFSDSSIVFTPPNVELPNHPFTGDPGSQFIIRDDVGENQQLEPVAKILIQDVRVLRVVRPGDSYDASGTLANKAPVDTGTTQNADQLGYLVLEVTPAQAEVLTFIQDSRHQYQVIVRGKDDHSAVTTQGVTFQILATNSDWSLPWPQSLTAPKAQTKSSGTKTQGGASSAATPTATSPAAATPGPSAAAGSNNGS